MITFISCKSSNKNDVTKFYSASGQISGKIVSVDVDSLAAKELLNNDLTKFPSKIPSNSELEKLVKSYSIDYATIYLLNSIYKNNRNLQNKYLNYINKLRHIERYFIDNNKQLMNYHIVFIPGLAYKLDTTTGADFARQRKLYNTHNISNDFIETDELGLTKDNAIIIKRYISEYKNYKKLVLVSASKGGLDVLYYLDKLAEKKDLVKIKAWINVGGVLKGTLIAEEVCNFPNSLVPSVILATKGKTDAIIGDLQRKTNLNRFTNNHKLSGIDIIHFVGVPLKTQVRTEIKSRFETLAPYGPNDGLTLITDTISIKGKVIVELGLDHYYKDPEIDMKTLALTMIITE